MQKNITMVNEHLIIPSRKIDRDKVRNIFEKAREVVDDIRFQWAKSDFGHIDESLKKNQLQYQR